MIPEGAENKHILAFGVTRMAGKFGSFGVSDTYQWVKPSRLRGGVIGEFGTGKTSFLASNPAALICNYDRSSTPRADKDINPPPAQFWPSMSPDGLTVDPNGATVKLTWTEIRKLEERLCEAAIKNQPRPEMIVNDSMTELFNLLREATLAHFKKESWDEGRGDAMWEWLYQQLNSFVNNLRHEGYGVWDILHIAPEYITEEDGKKKTRWAMTTPPGFFKRFYGGYEIALEMQKTFTTKVVPVVKEVKTDKGVIKMSENVVEDVASFTLVGENPERANLYKRRICLPKRIPLSSSDMWSAFEKAYLEAAVPSAAPAVTK